jgi:hypothetical protein
LLKLWLVYYECSKVRKSDNFGMKFLKVDNGLVVKMIIKSAKCHYALKKKNSLEFSLRQYIYIYEKW